MGCHFPKKQHAQILYHHEQHTMEREPTLKENLGYIHRGKQIMEKGKEIHKNF